MLKENVNKKVRNVLSVAAITAAIVPFAVNAANFNGSVTVEADGYAENITLTGDTTLSAEIKNATVEAGGKDIGKDITIDLGGYTLTSANSKGILAATNTGTITIKNGTVDCGSATTCVAGAEGGKVVLNDVTVKGVVDADSVEINGGEVVGAISSTTVKTSKTVKSADISNYKKMTAGTFVYNGTTALNEEVIKLPKGVKLVLGKDVTGSIKFEKDNYADFSNVSLENSDDYYLKMTDGGKDTATRTYTITKVAVVLTELTAVKDKYNNLSTEQKEAVEKLLPEGFSWTEFDALDSTSTKSTIDWYVKSLNSAINGKKFDGEEKPADPIKKDDPQQAQQQAPTNVADVKSEDNVATKNPKTADSILSYVGLAISSLAGLGVAAKKYLFK